MQFIVILSLTQAIKNLDKSKRYYVEIVKQVEKIMGPICNMRIIKE